MDARHRDTGHRRRGEVLEAAILSAAMDELAETGYDAFTMERVATRARTSKAALYRRWSGRAELALEACKARDTAHIDVPDTGNLRADVLALLRQVAASMASPLGGILRGLLTEMTRDPEFARLIHERIHAVGPTTIRVILEQAIERGEVDHRMLDSRRATVATDLLRNHFLMFGVPIADEVIVDIVDDVYLPLIRKPAGPDGHHKS